VAIGSSFATSPSNSELVYVLDLACQRLALLLVKAQRPKTIFLRFQPDFIGTVAKSFKKQIMREKITFGKNKFAHKFNS